MKEDKIKPIKKPTEYYVVTNLSPVMFNSQIQDLIASGWQLQSGVSIAVHPTGEVMYAQALIR